MLTRKLKAAPITILHPDISHPISFTGCDSTLQRSIVSPFSSARTSAHDSPLSPRYPEKTHDIGQVPGRIYSPPVSSNFAGLFESSSLDTSVTVH